MTRERLRDEHGEDEAERKGELRRKKAFWSRVGGEVG